VRRHEWLGLIRCVMDPRIGAGRWIVLTQHFAASEVLTELAQSRRVVERNEELASELAETEANLEGIIPYETGLGPLLRMRELEADRPSPPLDYGSLF
jgi:hypothetical protein